MKTIASCFGLFLMTSVVSARVTADVNTARELYNQNLTIADYLRSHTLYTTFTAATNGPSSPIFSNLGHPILGDTVFAPVDIAFTTRNTTATIMQRLLQPEYVLHLQNLLNYHVYAGGLLLSTSLNSSALSTTVTMANNETLTITLTNPGELSLSNKKNGVMAKSYATDTDILCENGVLHAIDGVLLPNLLPR
jgi:uncharacterized surface protein with fasciclin (FAS1) repeats